MNKDELESLCIKIRECLDKWSADGTLETVDGSEHVTFQAGVGICYGMFGRYFIQNDWRSS
ncbi:hypothetical protein LOF14_27780 [Klebsiella variicola subsp. variicola]|nr:hypothetical protein LOF14_27780 [Klebsiella variicola subsp. variicola]